MPEARKLIIEALAKVGGVTDLQKVVKALTRDATDLQKVLGKISIGGAKGPTDQAAITKQFDQMVKKLREIGVVSKDTAKILGETMGRAIDNERQKLKDLTDAIKDTEDQYKSAKDRVTQFKDALKTGTFEGHQVQDRDFLQRMLEREQDRVSGLGKRQAEQVGQADQSRRNLTGPGNEWIKDVIKSIPSISSGAFIAQAVRQILNAPEILNRLDMQYASGQSRIGAVYGGLEAARRGGDLRYSAAIRSILSNENSRNELRNIAGNQFRDYFDGAVGVAGGFAKVDPNQIVSALTKFTDNNPAAAERVGNLINTTLRGMPLTGQALDYLRGRADNDVNFFRLAGNYNDMHGGMLAAGAAHFSPDVYQSIVSGIIGRSGRGGSSAGLRDLGVDITKLTASGVDPGVLAAVAGMGNPFGSSRALARNVASFDPNVAGLIGGYSADNFSGGAGYTDGRALMAAISNGGGGPMGAFNVQNNIAGLGGIQALMSGSIDGFQRGRNLVTALGVLGPNASLEGAQALAGMNDMPRMLEILRGGNTSRAMRAMGIDGKKARSYITQTLDSLASRTLNENDPSALSQLQRAVRGGVHMSDLLTGSASIEGIDTDGALEAFLQSRMGMTENAASGFIRDLRGKRLRNQPRTDGAAASPAKEQQDANIAGQVAVMGQAMADIGAAAKQAHEPFTQMTAQMEKATVAVKNLNTAFANAKWVQRHQAR